MKAHLRIANRQDAPVIHEIYGYYVEHSLATFNEVNKSVEYRAEELDALLETYPYLVAEDEACHFLGFACAEPFRPQTGYHCTVELTIYLHPDTPHHSGVGRLLYTALLRILQEQGFHSAYGVLWGDNVESARLHEALDFERVACFANSAFKHGQWLDSVYYRKALNPFEPNPQPPIPFREYRKNLNL